MGFILSLKPRTQGVRCWPLLPSSSPTETNSNLPTCPTSRQSWVVVNKNTRVLGFRLNTKNTSNSKTNNPNSNSSTNKKSNNNKNSKGSMLLGFRVEGLALPWDK